MAARQTEEEIEKSRSQASRDLDENHKRNLPPPIKKKEKKISRVDDCLKYRKRLTHALVPAEVALMGERGADE